MRTLAHAITTEANMLKTLSQIQKHLCRIVNAMYFGGIRLNLAYSSAIFKSSASFFALSISSLSYALMTPS